VVTLLIALMAGSSIRGSVATFRKMQVERAARFRTRWLPGLAANMRILYDGSTWDIASVEQMYGRDRELHVYAHAGLTAG
jgi:hypothetical protein